MSAGLVVLGDVLCCVMPTHVDMVVEQPALLRHGGYGGTERTTVRSCSRCGFARTVAVDTVRPRRRSRTLREVST